MSSTAIQSRSDFVNKACGGALRHQTQLSTGSRKQLIPGWRSLGGVAGTAGVPALTGRNFKQPNSIRRINNLPLAQAVQYEKCEIAGSGSRSVRRWWEFHHVDPFKTHCARRGAPQTPLLCGALQYITSGRQWVV